MEILKQLLRSTLDKKLERLENRGKEHCIDLDYCAKYYIKQGKEVEKLSQINIEEILLKRNKSRETLKRDISAQTIRPRNKEQNEKKEKIRNKTPTFHPPKDLSRSKTPTIRKTEVNGTIIRSKRPNIDQISAKENNNNDLNKTVKFTRNKTPDRNEQSNKKHIAVSKRRVDKDRKETSPSLKPKSKPNQITISACPSTKVVKKVKATNDNSNNIPNNNHSNSSNDEIEPLETVVRLSTMDTNKVFLHGYVKEKSYIHSLLIENYHSAIFASLYSYLDCSEKMNFYSTMKCFKSKLCELIHYKKKLFEERNNITSNSSLDDKLDAIQAKYPLNELESNLSPFELSRGSLKVIELLNEQVYTTVFRHQTLQPRLKEIILPFRILFQLANRQDLSTIKDDKEFWNNIHTIFSENKDKKNGDFIHELIKEFEFSNESIDMIKRMTFGKLSNINPNYYSKICGTTSLILYPIKDALEYSGIIPSLKNNPMIIYNSLCYLKNIEDRMNKYIDYLL